MNYHKPPFHLKELKIEITYKCPLACIHCSSDSTPENDLQISYAKCIDILDEAKMMGIEEIAFSGGEPLEHPNFEDIIKHAGRLKLRTTLYTSGNSQNFNSKLQRLIKSGLLRIIFSLYSSNETEHEQITRRKGSYDSTIIAIGNAVLSGISTELHFVALSRNYHRLPELVVLGKSLGVNKISVLRFVPQGRGVLLNKDVLTKLQYLELKQTIEGLRQNGQNIRTGSPFNFLLLSEQPSCNSAIDRLIIAPNLRIYPCDAFKQIDAEDLVGSLDYSILNGYSLNECWIKSPYLRAIRNYLTTDFIEPCVGCNLLEKCLSGCLAQKVLFNSSLNKGPDPDCIC